MKGFLQIIGVIALLTLAFAFATAYGAAPVVPTQPPIQTIVDQTANVILVEVDGKPRTLIFIGKDGSNVGVSYEECKAKPSCRAVSLGVAAAGRLEVLDLPSGTQV